MKTNDKSKIFRAVMATPLPEKRVVPALICDLVNTVCRSKSGLDYIRDLDDIELMPGIEPMLWHYRKKGYLVGLISNHGEVAMGTKRPEDCEKELDHALSLFEINPVQVAKQCYFMGSGTVRPYNNRSLCRKPDIGMLAMIEAEAWHSGLVIDWDNSLFVGDKPLDAKTAANAGMRFKNVKFFLLE